MADESLLDQIAQLGLFGKRYKDFTSAPVDAQKTIRVLAASKPTLPPVEASGPVMPQRRERTSQTEARFRKLEASIARIEKGMAKIIHGIERLEQLDVIRSAAKLKMDRSHKIRAGQTKAARLGKHIGRPPREFARDEAMRLRAEGHSLREIAGVLGVPVSTIADTLRPSVPKVIAHLGPN